MGSLARISFAIFAMLALPAVSYGLDDGGDEQNSMARKKWTPTSVIPAHVISGFEENLVAVSTFGNDSLAVLTIDGIVHFMHPSSLLQTDGAAAQPSVVKRLLWTSFDADRINLFKLVSANTAVMCDGRGCSLCIKSKSAKICTDLQIDRAIYEEVYHAAAVLTAGHSLYLRLDVREVEKAPATPDLTNAVTYKYQIDQIKNGTLKYSAKSRDRESVLSVAMLDAFASREGRPYFVEIAFEKFGHNLQFAHTKVHLIGVCATQNNHTAISRIHWELTCDDVPIREAVKEWGIRAFYLPSANKVFVTTSFRDQRTTAVEDAADGFRNVICEYDMTKFEVDYWKKCGQLTSQGGSSEEGFQCSKSLGCAGEVRGTTVVRMRYSEDTYEGQLELRPLIDQDRHLILLNTSKSIFQVSKTNVSESSVTNTLPSGHGFLWPREVAVDNNGIIYLFDDTTVHEKLNVIALKCEDFTRCSLPSVDHAGTPCAWCAQSNDDESSDGFGLSLAQAGNCVEKGNTVFKMSCPASTTVA